MKFCKEFLEKTVLKNDCSQFSRSKRSVAKLFFCYVVWEMEKTICSLQRLKFILISIKNMCVPMKPQRVISATSG